MNIILYILGCIIFLILQSAFSGSEIAFISSNRIRLQHCIRRGDKRAEQALKLVSNPERFLATTLVGTNISVVVSSSLATLCLISLGVKNSSVWIMFLFTPVVVIFSELFPKNIGVYYREKFSCAVSPYIIFLEYLLFPIVFLVERTSALFVKLLMGRKRKEHSLFVTREEIKSIFKEIKNPDILDRGEKEAIEDILDFKETKIRDVMTPIKYVAGFDYTDSYKSVLTRAKRYRFTRYPVFRNRVITGYINIFDIFYNSDNNWLISVRPIMRVGESQKLYEVSTALRNKRESMALVMRGKKVIGIVTIDDIIREIITSIVKD